MHAPQARISKPNLDDDSAGGAVSVIAQLHLHDSSRLTIIRGEALDPQSDVQEKDHDERRVKNIPHL